MEIPGIGEGFRWWHAITGVSAAALIACIGRDWPNGAVIAAGFVGIGIGTWAMHPNQTKTWWERGHLMASQGPIYQPSWSGWGIVIAGGLAIAQGVVKSLL